MSDRLQCTVSHVGVPIGTVDLELLGTQGLGTLAPLPGYVALRPHLRLASLLGAAARVELLTRTPDDAPSHPWIARASLPFELTDTAGALVSATAVRVVELKTRPGVTVVVDLGDQCVGTPATCLPLDRSTPAEERHPDESADGRSQIGA